MPVGTAVPASVTSRWPISNRLAMERNGFIEFFQSADQAAAEGAIMAMSAREHPALTRIDAEARQSQLAVKRPVNAKIAKMNAARARKRLESMGLLGGAANEAPAELEAAAA